MCRSRAKPAAPVVRLRTIGLQELDTASAGLAVASAQRIALNIHSGLVIVHLQTAPTVWTSASASVRGTVVLGRMASMRPVSESLIVPVGRWRTQAVLVPARSCQPPVKAYTNISIEAQQSKLTYPTGINPTLAALARAVRRALPADVTGNGLVARVAEASEALPWWDRLRYKWRGRLTVSASDCAVVLQQHSLICGGCADGRRVDITFGNVSASSAPDSELKLSLADVQASVRSRQRPGIFQSIASLSHLPLCALSYVGIDMSVLATLPGHRNMTQHHVFPTLPFGHKSTDCDSVQGPIDVSEAMTSQGINLQCSVTITRADGKKVRCRPQDAAGLRASGAAASMQVAVSASGGLLAQALAKAF